MCLCLQHLQAQVIQILPFHCNVWTSSDTTCRGFSSKKEDAIANTTGEENKDRIIDDHLSCQSKVVEKVKENIRAAQARQKEAYDKKHHNPKTFKVGALVLRKDMKQVV